MKGALGGLEAKHKNLKGKRVMNMGAKAHRGESRSAAGLRSGKIFLLLRGER